MTTDFIVENHFENKSPVVREIYDGLIKKVKSFGKFQKEPHKTSIRLLNQTPACVCCRPISATMQRG